MRKSYILEQKDKEIEPEIAEKLYIGTERRRDRARDCGKVIHILEQKEGEREPDCGREQMNKNRLFECMIATIPRLHNFFEKLSKKYCSTFLLSGGAGLSFFRVQYLLFIISHSNVLCTVICR